MMRMNKIYEPDEAERIVDHIADITLEAYNKDIQQGFEKQSRSAQIGYNVTKYLMDLGIIRIGKFDPQRKLGECKLQCVYEIL